MSGKFRAFDGEGADNEFGRHSYFLLAARGAEPLVDRDRGQLDYMDCLDYLTKREYRDSKNIWYSFNYDVNMIFRDLPKEDQTELVHARPVKAGEYLVTYIPRKILRISKGRTNWLHYDCHTFFAMSFVKALGKWNVHVPEIIVKGKQGRREFNRWDIDDVIEYNNQELYSLERLMETLDTQLLANDIHLENYHGPGAIASDFLDKWELKRHLPKKANSTIKLWRRKAYFGGRIELFKRGRYEGIHHYDINSAYPGMMRTLPSLAEKEWELWDNPTANELRGKFGLIRAEWDYSGWFKDGTSSSGMKEAFMGPLPYRNRNMSVRFPQMGKGIYHIIEVLAALDRGYRIKTPQAVVLKEPYTFPFAKPVSEMARRRLEIKRVDEMRSRPLKLGMNSVYGKLAQKPSEDGRPGPYRELLYSGYQTAGARAKMMEYADPRSVIAFLTDGIFSLTKLPCPISNELGEFEYQHHDEGIFILAGCYELDGEARTRGYSQGIDIKKIYRHQLDKADVEESFEVNDSRFIGIRKGLKLKDKSLMCTFSDEVRLINWDHNNKRRFAPMVHDMSTPSNDIQGEESYPYMDNGFEDERGPEYDDIPEWST